MVNGGVTVSCTYNSLQWNGDTNFGMHSKTFLANTNGGTLSMSYDSPRSNIGSVSDFGVYGWYPTIDNHGVAANGFDIILSGIVHGLDGAGITLAAVLTADAAGFASYSTFIPPGACGNVFVHCIDGTTCATICVSGFLRQVP